MVPDTFSFPKAQASAGLKDWLAAIAAYREALRLAPRHRNARRSLAIALLTTKQFQEAEPFASELAHEEPNNAEAWALLGTIQYQRGKAVAAAQSIRQSVALDPDPTSYATLLYCLQFEEDVTSERLLQAHSKWNAACAAPRMSQPQPIAHTDNSHRRLRVGLVSADFARHPTGFLVLPALENLDRSCCEVICYSDRSEEDEYTRRFRAVASEWRFTAEMSDDELSQVVKSDQIDILIDLMGHTGKRLLAFARRSAPTQITWFGYVGTTGLAAMDYLLADRFHVAPGEEHFYSESILRMPHAYSCYGPPADVPEPNTLPALKSGRVTFGCFNHPAKLHPSLARVWAEILNAVPGSRLVIKYAGLNDPDIEGPFRQELSRLGVGEERVVMEGQRNIGHPEFLAHYGRVDLALDTQPYSGGLTTCEALWMGVPVITFPGKTFAGRHATSYMMNAGYPQFVAPDAKGYVKLAVKWAQRIDELAAIRATMREQVRLSPLCDAPRFARDFLAVIQQAWEHKVARQTG